MLIRKAYKFRLKPTDEQSARLAVLCGHARFVWNNALRHCLSKLDNGEKVPSYAELCKLVTQWKKDDDLSWLKEAYTDNLQQKLKDLHGAWMRCFNKSLAAEKPRFKKKGKNQDSIRFVNFNKYCQLDGKRVKLPSKIGWLKFSKSQEVQGNIKNCTVSFKSGHWYISFQVEQEIDEPKHSSTSAIGVDMGIAKFITLSDGSALNSLNAFRKHEKRLAIEQRKLSRKVKFSANWQKQKAKIQKLHTLIADCRKDYLHKASHLISKNHAMIAIEDLRVSNMSKSAKGSAEVPGKNVKAKSGLNKSILDQGWYEFRRQLEYKQLWNGGLVVAVPAQYTSQTCPCCGHASKDNRKTQAHFECVECGYTNNADIVGALNILERGHRLLACGESALVA
ncbi:transposase [Vibrio aestuarianus]|uniref:RNA-guided endonuclease InsQ/TnpB family protein n=1 Tax=Vibrio aestuarianus TaxID=28171 RepID=UPI0015946F3E|nr:RNA-guided endonuclease TnpB family protein [Vibrio aestuarianus]NGZ17579.1 transposase [Vibrio aestuarianus]